MNLPYSHEDLSSLFNHEKFIWAYFENYFNNVLFVGIHHSRHTLPVLPSTSDRTRGTTGQTTSDGFGLPIFLVAGV